MFLNLTVYPVSLSAPIPPSGWRTALVNETAAH